MESIKEENKSLIASKNNYYAVIITITAGIVWLFFANVNPLKLLAFFFIGVYFDALYVLRLQDCERRLRVNIERLKKYGSS